MCSARAAERMEQLKLIDAASAFSQFDIDSSEFLDTIDGRSICSMCGRSRKFFCYTCFIVMPPLEGKLRHVKLPLEVAIVKHPQEIDGKSTATHGPILAPSSVRIYNYPELPDTSKAILIFPSADAVDAVEFMERNKKEHEGKFPFDRVIFIDSTWNQTNKISSDPRIAGLPKVKLSGIESLFWRYQRGNPTTHLATIEAVYYFSRVYHEAYIDKDYKHEFDNILFFFRYMFNKVRRLYDPNKLRAYATRPHLQE